MRLQCIEISSLALDLESRLEHVRKMSMEEWEDESVVGRESHEALEIDRCMSDCFLS